MYKSFNPFFIQFSPRVFAPRTLIRNEERKIVGGGGSVDKPNEVLSNVRNEIFRDRVPVFKECNELDCETDSDCKEKNCDTCDTTTKTCKPRVVDLSILPDNVLTNIASQQVLSNTDLANMSETSRNLHEGSILERKRRILIKLIKRGNIEEISRFFEENPGFSVNYVDDRLEPPLIIAIITYYQTNRVHIDIVNLLIEKGADLNIRDGYNDTALTRSSAALYVDITKLLLEKGADPNIENDNGVIPLRFIIWNKALYSRNDYLDLIELMLEKGADPNNYPDIMNSPNGPLINRVIDDMEAIKLFVKYNADINILDNKRNSPIVYAALMFNKAAEEAAAAEADEAAAAAEVAANDIVEFLIKKGADINILFLDQRYSTLNLLQLYIRNKNLEMVTLLLNYGAIITPETLDVLEDGDFIDYSKLLLKHGADPNIKNKRGETPLIKASIVDDLILAELLLSNGADPNSQDSNGATALIHSADNINITKLLLSKGSDPNIKDDLSWTALMHAIDFSDDWGTKIIKELLENGADPTIISLFHGNELTPFDYNKYNKSDYYKEIEALLLKHGAKP